MTPRSPFISILIIHIALTLGQIFFAIVTFSLTPDRHFDINTKGDILIFIVPVFAISGFVLSSLLYKRSLDGINAEATVSQKLAAFQTGMIIRLALLEGPSLFSIVVYLSTGNLLFLIISLVIILYFIALIPTKDKISDAAKLNYDERL